MIRLYNYEYIGEGLKYKELSKNIYATTFDGKILNIFEVEKEHEGIKYAICIHGTPHAIDFELTEQNTKHENRF